MKKPSLSIVVEGKLPAELKPEVLQKIAESVVDNTLLKHEANVGLKFVGEAESKKLNKQYAYNDYATDVLSFPYPESKDTLGDIVICLPVAKAQAKTYEVSVQTELSLLLIHGILHLLNYDHQSTQDTASMDWLQGAIMKSLNLEYRDFKWSH